jgi:hypothetical protein
MAEIICFVPEQNNCTAYKEGEISATLCTKYHYGGGGDAALILYITEPQKNVLKAEQSKTNESICH